MKRQGRLIWQNYLGSGPAVMSTVLNLIRTRAGLPPAPANDEPSNDIFDEDSKPLIMDSLPIDMEPGESLGPLEPPMASRYVIVKTDSQNLRLINGRFTTIYSHFSPTT